MGSGFLGLFFLISFLYRQRCKVAGGRCLEPGNIEFHGPMNETECARLNSLNILGYYSLVETVRGLILIYLNDGKDIMEISGSMS